MAGFPPLQASIGLLYYLQNDPKPDIGAPHRFELDLAKAFLHQVEVTGQMDQVSVTGTFLQVYL